MCWCNITNNQTLCKQNGRIVYWKKQLTVTLSRHQMGILPRKVTDLLLCFVFFRCTYPRFASWIGKTVMCCWCVVLARATAVWKCGTSWSKQCHCTACSSLLPTQNWPARLPSGCIRTPSSTMPIWRILPGPSYPWIAPITLRPRHFFHTLLALTKMVLSRSSTDRATRFVLIIWFSDVCMCI